MQSKALVTLLQGDIHRGRLKATGTESVLLFIDRHCAGVSNKQCLLTFFILPDFLSSEL